MEWLPSHLTSEDLGHADSWAQHVKQMIMMGAGIETKRQEEMDKGSREAFIMDEYNRWCEVVERTYDNAMILEYLHWTTGKREKPITGYYLYRNFTEGLRVFHNTLNKI